MYKNTVDLIGIDSSNELTAIRGCLEYWEVRANMYWTGQPQHIVELLDGRERRSEHILLAGHGEENGFHMVELAGQLEATQPFSRIMTPEHVRDHLTFDNTVVLSTACMTGTEQMAEAFLAKGAKYYLAPSDYPEGSAALYFATSFYYHLFCNNHTIEEAHLRAAGTDQETRMFELYGR